MFWNRRRKEQELDEEIAGHLRMAEQDSGHDQARQEFGNVGLVKEVTREMWGFGPLERLWQDLRYAVRVLQQNRGYTLTAVLSLALGIGANTAVFSLIDAVMLESLPVKNPQELVSLGDPGAVQSLSIGTGGNTKSFSYPFFKRFREENGVFSDLYAAGRCARLDLNNEAEHPTARFVSNNFFSVLGVSFAQGRAFLPEDREAVVISYAFWQQRFPETAKIIGHKLTLNHRDFVIVGVAPRHFFGDVVGYESDLWLPIEAQPDLNPGHNYVTQANAFWLQLMGRPKPGVTLAQISHVANTLGIEIIREQAAPFSLPAELKSLGSKRIDVQSGAGGFSRIRHTFAPMLKILLALVALVLLICCANVANLQMARAVSRGREMGLRLAIGANRARLLRQLLTESVVLAVAGGAAALLAGYWISHFLVQLAAHNNNRLPFEPHLSVTALLFTAAISALSILIFGLAPALFATKGDVAAHLKESKTGRSKGGAQRFEKGLVASQIVLSLVLLYGSGLFIRTLQNLEKSDVGYHRENLLIVEVDPWGAGYKDSQIAPFTKNLTAVLSALPGVNRVSFSENGLFSGTESQTDNAVEGFTPRTPEDEQSRSDRVGPNYFSTVGIPILAGREITEQDNQSAAPVAVVNEAFVRFYFPNRQAIGHHVSNPDGTEPRTIVGVVGTVKQRELREPAGRRLYTAYWQAPKDPPESLRYEIRTANNLGLMETAVRQAISKADGSLHSPRIAWSQALIEDELEQERLIAKLSSFFSVLALLLASVGLYGVMSYLTARRTTEVGVRMALGATRSSVIALVFKEAFSIAAIGLFVGVGCAFAVGKLTASTLYGVSAFDPITVSAATGIICCAAALASWLPARRASRVDPMIALRSE